VAAGALLTTAQANPAWLLSSFGALALVAGLGLQDILKNVLAGLYLLVERPFDLGDDLEVDGQRGRVRMIRSRVTILEGEDGARVIVPNADVLSKTVIRR
jgi:small-conductance mechanosensitive channel